MKESVYEVRIAGRLISLPVREVAPGVRVAVFNPLGDWEITEFAGTALARLVPMDVQALIMPDGKANALLHVVGRELELPTFIARKEKKPYMAEPVVHVSYESITTRRVQTLFLSADDGEKLAGKKVAIVDDVVSTGGTLVAAQHMLRAVGAEHVATLAVFTEGEKRDDVIALGHLPLL